MFDPAQLLTQLTKETVYLIILVVYAIGVYVIISRTERPPPRHPYPRRPITPTAPPSPPPRGPPEAPPEDRRQGQPVRTVEDVLLGVGACIEKAERQRRGKPLYA